MRFLKALLLIAIFTFGLLFFIQNSKALEAPLALTFSLYYGDLTWTSQALPFFVIVLAAFAVGAVLSALYLLIDRIRLGCSLVGCKSSLRSAEKEAKRLRAALEKETKGKEAKAIEAKAKELPQGAAKPA